MTTISPLRPGPGGPADTTTGPTRPRAGRGGGCGRPTRSPPRPEPPGCACAGGWSLWSLPFLVVLALVATKLLTMVALGDEALKSYTAGNVTGTEDAGKRLGFLNLIEAHKAPFARGDARVLAGDYEGARAAFEESLALAPKDSRESCQIRVNLALSLEKLGQAAQNAGNAAQAKQYFDRVQQVVNEAPPGCFEGPAQDEEGQQLRDAQQRAQDQQQQQQQQGQQQPDQQQTSRARTSSSSSTTRPRTTSRSASRATSRTAPSPSRRSTSPGSRTHRGTAHTAPSRG